jgi:hypothetical protein
MTSPFSNGVVNWLLVALVVIVFIVAVLVVFY